MATPADALRIDYDACNDVLRVFTTPEPADSIALPGEDVTLLVFESLDRVLGVVFEHYTPLIRRDLPDDLRAIPDDDIRRLAMSFLENIVPSLIQGCGPVAKDQVVQWLQMLDRPAG